MASYGAVAQQFARGMRFVNEYPTLARAELQKQHIFAVFLDREESELVVDPRRLRKLAQNFRVKEP
jgi:hypothetical protein